MPYQGYARVGLGKGLWLSWAGMRAQLPPMQLLDFCRVQPQLPPIEAAAGKVFVACAAETWMKAWVLVTLMPAACYLKHHLGPPHFLELSAHALMTRVHDTACGHVLCREEEEQRWRKGCSLTGGATYIGMLVCSVS